MTHRMSLTISDDDMRTIDRAAAIRRKSREEWIIQAALHHSRQQLKEPFPEAEGSAFADLDTFNFAAFELPDPIPIPQRIIDAVRTRFFQIVMERGLAGEEISPPVFREIMDQASKEVLHVDD